jgi:capsular polysaccharide biosynthesis protein
MKNYEQFLAAGKVRFPNEKWVSVIDAPSLREQVETWAHAKMAIGGHGSAFANMVWMSPKCVLFIVDVMFCDQKSYMPLAMSMGLKLFASMSQHLTVISWFELDIDFMLDVVDKGLRYLRENGM